MAPIASFELLHELAIHFFKSSSSSISKDPDLREAMRDENHQRQKRRARLVEKKSRHSRVNLITVISQHYVQTGVNKLFRYFLHVLYKLGVRDSVSRSRLAENLIRLPMLSSVTTVLC